VWGIRRRRRREESFCASVEEESVGAVSERLIGVEMD
jgi:hypothetical protein